MIVNKWIMTEQYIIGFNTFFNIRLIDLFFPRNIYYLHKASLIIVSSWFFSILCQFTRDNRSKLSIKVDLFLLLAGSMTARLLSRWPYTSITNWFYFNKSADFFHHLGSLWTPSLLNKVCLCFKLLRRRITSLLIRLV